MDQETEAIGTKTVPAPAGDVVTLPVGVIDDKGVIHRECIVSKMTGRDRKDIADQDVIRNGGKILTTLLMNRVEQIGDIDISNPKIKRGVLLDMNSSDRTFLILAIRNLSYGKDLSFVANCTSCGEKNEVSHRFQDMEIKPVPEHTVEGKFRWVTVKIDKPRLEAVLRFPTGADEELISPFVKNNPIEASYKTLRRCLKSYNGDTNLMGPFIDELPLDELDALSDEWNRLQPGLDISFNIECFNCREPMLLSLQALDFLFPSPRRRG